MKNKQRIRRFLPPLILLVALLALLLPSATNVLAAVPAQDRWAGAVSDVNGEPLMATVTINGTQVEAKEDGSFELYVPRADDNRYVINAEKFGYVPVSIVHVGNAIEKLELTLQEPERFKIDPEQAIEVKDRRGTAISIPAGSLVDADGNPAKGPLQLFVYTYDLTQEEMVGDMSGINGEGKLVSLESAGAFFAQFSDEKGNEYNLAPKAQAQISIPVDQSAKFPEAIPLWSYEEEKGLWIQEGEALQKEERYVGDVSHFSVWNFDVEKQEPACIQLTVDPVYLALNSPIQVKAVLNSPTRVRNLSITQSNNVLINLPANTNVDFYMPPTAATPFASVNTGAPWGGTGVPAHPYDKCNDTLHLDGSQKKGTISGTKFHDLNGNGVRDPHESGLEGVTIELIDGNGVTDPEKSGLEDVTVELIDPNRKILAVTTTAEDGSYVFSELPSGSYTVSEVVPDGWQPTTPASVTVILADGGVAKANFGNTKAILANRIRYQIGSTYTYRSQLAVVNKSEFKDTAGTRTDESTADINTLVDLTAVGKVGEDYLLEIKVYSTQITQTGQQEIITDTSQSPFGDELTEPFFVIQKPTGEVTSVLSSNKDSEMARNLKKGVVSNIQIYLQDDETAYTVVVTDTSGVYQAEYNTTVAENTLQLIKKATQDDYLELPGGESMDENMRLTSTNTIQFDRRLGVVTSVLSQEDASFTSPDEPTQPGNESFDFQMNTDGDGTMRLIEVTPNQDSPALPSGTLEQQKQALENTLKVSLTVTNLIAESVPEEFITDGEPAAIDGALKILNTDPTNPGSLSELVDAIQSDLQGVQIIAKRLQSGDINTDSRATVASALSAVGSDEAQNLLLDEFLLKNKADLTEQEHLLVLLSMQQEPTERVIGVVEEFGNDESSESSEQATLVLGALAYTISDTNPARTAQIVEVFEARLGEATETSQVDFQLMAVGNAGQNRSIPVVEPYLNHESPLIRARAVETLRKMTSTEVESLLRSQFEKDENETVRATIVEVQNERGIANTNHQSRAMANIISWSWSKTYGSNNLNATLGARVEANGAPFYFSAKGYAKAKAWGYERTLAEARLLSERANNGQQKFGAYFSLLNNNLLKKEVFVNCGGSGSGTLVNKSYTFFNRSTPRIPVLKIFTLRFTAKISGHLKVPYTYAYDLCSDTNTHAEGTITPEVWVRADGYATLSLWFVRGGVGVRTDLLDTAVPLSASIDLTNAKFTFCYSADLKFQAVNGKLYAWGQVRRWIFGSWGKRHEVTLWSFNTRSDIRNLISGCPSYYLPPELTIDKTHVGNFEKGGVGSYSIKVENVGGPTTAPIVVTDVLPSSVTYVSGSGDGWSCTASGATVTCTHSGLLAHQTSSSLLMDVALDHSATIKNCAKVSTKGEQNLANNQDCDVVSLIHGISLVPGWNLISIPVQPIDTDISQVLTSIAGSYDLVYAYDGCDATDQWKNFNPSAPPFANDLTDVDQTMGLWIHMTAAAKLSMSGTIPRRTNISLCSGWNLTGYPSNLQLPVANALTSIDGAYDLVYAYDAADTADPWASYNPSSPPFANDLTEMGPGWGYWIDANQDATWTVSNLIALP